MNYYNNFNNKNYIFWVRVLLASTKKLLDLYRL